MPDSRRAPLAPLAPSAAFLLVLAGSFLDQPVAGEAGPVSRAAAENEIVRAVSVERARRTVHDLVALGPRSGGTSSGDRAASYVERRLREIGLQVEVATESPRDAFDLISFEARLTSPRTAALAAWPVAFSPPLAEVELAIRLSPPGKAPHGDPRQDMPWALLTNDPPDGAASRAAAAGARAALTDVRREEAEYLDAAPALQFSRPDDARLPVFTLSRNDGARLRAWLAGGKTARARLKIEARTFRGSPRSVVGTLGGTKPGWFLVCAHGDSDSGGPGANDNASGVSSALEVAAALAAASSKGLLPAERPSVRIAVWGSEIRSTRAFVESHAADLGTLLGVFNFDQTGFGTRDVLYFEGNDVPWNRNLLTALMSVAADHAGRHGFPREYTTTPSLGGADGSVFLPREHRGFGLVTAEIPTTTVFVSAWGKAETKMQTSGWESRSWPEKGTVTIDFDPYYHSSGDLPEATTDRQPEAISRCARAVALAVLRLMGGVSPEAPPQAPPR